MMIISFQAQMSLAGFVDIISDEYILHNILRIYFSYYF